MKNIIKASEDQKAMYRKMLDVQDARTPFRLFLKNAGEKAIVRLFSTKGSAVEAADMEEADVIILTDFSRRNAPRFLRFRVS